MHSKSLLSIATIVLFTTGCSGTNNFEPKPEMSGKQIFDQACSECHESEGKYVMELKADMKDADRIANQVLTGNLFMPAFPNIQGEPAKKLSKYVLENSKFVE